jgi:hypothetical protein
MRTRSEQQMPQPELEKVRFFDADVGYENLWAEKRDADLYVIKSIPYFIYDISVEDVVRVAKDEADQTLCFSELVTHSEHSTIRVRPKDFTLDQQEGEELLRKIKSFGAVTETLPPRLVAVDIPSCGDVEPLTRFLTESHIPWEWADKAPC